MPFTTALDEFLIKHAFGGPIWTPPSTIYVALSTSAPTQQQSGSATAWNFTEATGGGYVRVGLVYNTTNFVPTTTEPTAGYQVQVGVAVQFPTSTGPISNGENLTNFGLFDAATAGNLLAYGPLNPVVAAIGPGYEILFPAGQLVTSLD